MATKTITDRNGNQFEWSEHDGHGFFSAATNKLIPEGWEAKIKEIKALELRNDDVMICTFPKAGTHWIWEIVSMVMKGTAEYETSSKEALMLEFQSAETISSKPSPRILNSHFAVSCLPKELTTKKIKTIHVMRNPKDIAASYFHLIKGFNWIHAEGKQPLKTFSDFLPYMTGEYGVHVYVSLWRYYKEMEQFTKENPELVLTLHFEEMKKNPTEAVRKVANFLNKDLTDEVIQSIADKCSFQNLKTANETMKQRPLNLVERLTEEEKGRMIKHKPPQMYRKGEVGDWKNHFTVAENEQFEKLLEENFKGTNIEFVYSI